MAATPTSTAVALASPKPSDATPVSQATTPSTPSLTPAAGAKPVYEARKVFSSLVFDQATDLQQPDDGLNRFFVSEQRGRILVFPNDQAVPAAEVFLDIQRLVNTEHNEEGLLGLAFDPGFTANGHFYVYYSAGSPRRNVLARFTAPGDRSFANPASQAVLLQILKPFGNHNGGQLVFGPDGYLYVSVGDGGGDNRASAQDNADLLGSILRIDVSVPSSGRPYSVPKDNPFTGVSGVRDEIWAYGFRNPWRISFDAAGRLWAADVGERKLEEIDIVQKKGNYGWPIMEGTSCYDSCKTEGLELPIWEYSHALGCSITGGYVVQSEPPSLIGRYVFADYCSGNVWTLTFDEVTEPSATLLFKSNLQIISFGRALDSGIYLVTRANGLYQIMEG